MAEPDVVVGDHGGLAFELSWCDPVPAGSAASATRARMCAYVAGHLVWGDADASGTAGFEWPWIELLEHMAASWKYLEWEELDPLGLGGEPDTARDRAEHRWLNMIEPDVEREDEVLRGFERTHNLASALRGAWPPAIWVLRAGAVAKLAAGGIRTTAPWESVLGALTTLGDALCERLASLDDERASAAVRAWGRRSAVSDVEFVSIATSLPEERVADLAGTGGIRKAFEVSERRPNELLIAARMLGSGLPAGTAKAVLSRVRATSAINAAGLDEWAEAATEVALQGVPHRQGRDLAIWARARLKLQDEESCDIEKLLRKLGVSVQDLGLAAKEIDAVCAWGPKHGPVVFINAKGPHAKGLRGRRATLAHELCHLLIDRSRTLPFGEVKGGRVPRDIEARANAFAAELLVPTVVAGLLLAGAAGAPAIELDRVCRRYGASRAIAAWQALNSGVALPSQMHRYLEMMAPKGLALGVG